MAKQKNIEDKSKIIDSSLESVLHNSMMPYSEHVILDRALPRVEDGLKPVQRRILYAMMELGITPDKPHKKCARIVGDCLGKYHPHGDSSVYGALVKLAQPYNTNMTLVDGHGNFGSIDGDSAAAMRYTEARLTPLALELLRDLDKNTVDMSLNFDDTLEEPNVLPGRYPNLLVNGASGIAVGMATNIPPHNLAEVIDGVVAFIDNSRISLDEMLKYIPAPDFPTGGWIVDNEDIKKSYETGRGRIIMRANTSVEKEGDRENIIIHELPYQVNKADLLQAINVQREKKKEIFGCISDILDESDRNGMRCVIKLRRESDSAKVLAGLYKSTNMECGFSVNMVAINNGKPETMGLLDIITCYVEHQRNIIYKRSQFELMASKRRQHILEGLLVAVNNIRQVVDIVLSSKTYTESKERLRQEFELSERQAIAVLDIPLKRLNKLDVGKMDEELMQLGKTIAELESILASKRKQLAVVRKEILEIKRKYATPRRSKILNAKQAVLNDIDLNAKVERKGKLVLTYNGNLKFMSDRSYDLASKSIVNCSESDLAKRVINADNNSHIIGWTAKGNAVVFSVDSLEDERWKSRGTNISKISKIDSDDVLIDITPACEIEGKQLYFYTSQGMVKKSLAEEYNITKKAIYPAVVLKDDDKLIGVQIADDECEYILMITQNGMVLNAEADIPTQGRRSSGVKGIQLDSDDKLVYASQNDTAGEVVIICDSGMSKKVLLPDIEPMRRYRKGLKIVDNKAGNLIYAGIIKDAIMLAVISPNGETFELDTEQISIEDRVSKGKNILKTAIKDSQSLMIGKCLEHNLID